MRDPRQEFKKIVVNLSPREQIEPEEIFFDSSKQRDLDLDEQEVERLELPIERAVFFIFEGLQILALLFIGAFSGYIVTARGAELSARAQYNSSRISPIFAERGLIYSEDGRILAQNEISFDIYISASKMQLSDTEMRELAQNIARGVNARDSQVLNLLESALEKNYSEFALLKGITRAQLNALNPYLADKPFIEIRQIARRNYPEDISFSHILGYTSEVSASELKRADYSLGMRLGRAGAEAFYDDILRGKTGFLLRKVDSTGEVFGQEIKKESERGSDLVLSINAKLQGRVRKILTEHMHALGIDSAVAVLLDPNDGRIYSMVSLPAYDNNLFEQGIAQEVFDELINAENKPFFNRAVGGEYPSGSVIKPIIALAALEEGIVSPSTLIYSGGAITVPSIYNSDVVYEFKDWKAHGWSDIRKAIADSVNIYFYTIGGGYGDIAGLGIQKLEYYLKKFSWGKALGIDLVGERSGLIPSPKWKKEYKGENWYIGDTYLTSIGQGDVLVTPLQIAASTAVFANKGTLFVPHIAQNIAGTSMAPQALIENFAQAKNIETVREGMRRAVLTGSSRFLAGFPHPVAGKTGTAQTGRSKNHAWFAGFAPYENPEVVVTVLLEEGDDSNYAVRAARDILGAYFEIYYPQN